uniref:PawS-like protein C.a n=1 Tax=Dimorphotheca sinuata TaxID=112408 RepID=A0A1V0JB75_DIMSI|nr:PawS-like protein C.a [Dimorphotheca sinuata]
MAKLAILAFCLAAFVAFFEVSAYKTTITTTNICDNDKSTPDVLVDSLPLTMNECWSLLEGQQLNHCVVHVTQRTSFNPKLRMSVANPVQQRGQLQECCNQLRQVPNDCQCQALQQVVEEARLQGQLEGDGLVEMLTKANELPNDCKLPDEECMPTLKP